MSSRRLRPRALAAVRAWEWEGRVDDVEKDVAAVSGLGSVPTILEVVCRATGMRFAAIARVTQDRWVACAIRDEIAFGLQPGGELPIETTICNEIRQTGQLVVIDHVVEDRRFAHHPIPKRYGFQSYISVPIVLPDGRFFGTLCALDPAPAKLNNSQTIGMFTLFAQLIALQLAQHDRLAELESGIAERTEALNQANAQLTRQLAETHRDREALRALTAEMQRIREKERTALARDLHDEFGQALTTLTIELANAQKALESPGPRAAGAILREVDGIVESMFSGVQRIVSELRPTILDTLGFPKAAAWAVAELGRRTGVRAVFVDDPTLVVPADVSLVLFRVLQEALTNVARHAGASSVQVTLGTDGASLVLRVEDDGRGIADGEATSPHAFGLKGIEERLRAVNGTVTVQRRSIGGTELSVRLPAQPQGG
jgi:signal transduction histidine kinase